MIEDAVIFCPKQLLKYLGDLKSLSFIVNTSAGGFIDYEEAKLQDLISSAFQLYQTYIYLAIKNECRDNPTSLKRLINSEPLLSCLESTRIEKDFLAFVVKKEKTKIVEDALIRERV